MSPISLVQSVLNILCNDMLYEIVEISRTLSIMIIKPINRM